MRWVCWLVVASGYSCALLEWDVVARIRSHAGHVEVAESEGAAPVAAQRDLGLYEGNVIATGEDSRATIAFTGGNEVVLNDNARLIISRSGAEAELSAMLLGGTAQVTSKGDGLSLTIGTPLGLTTVGASAASLEIGVETGIKVLVGEVVVELEDGATTVRAGNVITVDGLVVPMGAAVEGLDIDAGIELEPIEITLLANPKQVQVKRLGEEKWRAPKKRDVLGAGDALRTRNASGTDIQFADGASLTMAPNSEVELLDAGASQSQQKAQYALRSGTATVKINRLGDDEHEIKTSKATFKVKPGITAAEVDVTAGKKGRSRVDVRLGQVLLPDGTVIEAGSTASLKNGKVEGKIKALANDGIALRPKSSSRVHYLGQIPKVAFAWKGASVDGQPSYTIEVAKDKDFNQVVFGERVSKKGFVWEGLLPGQYWWRVQTNKGWEGGTVKILKHVERDCPNCKHVNNIEDNGERSKVYYQQVLPALTFRWTALRGASEYRVRVFRDGAFDEAFLDQGSKENRLSLKAGRLKEGKYFWHVVALDSAGGELATSAKMNGLEIVFDNVVSALKIRSPNHGAKTRSATVTASGILELGLRLSINGKSVGSDGKGRFRQNVRLSKGFNRLVFRVLGKDGVERFTCVM